MQTVSDSNFGPLIAYLIPGATALWGVSLFAPPVHRWFATTTTLEPTIGGFLYLTVASLSTGMVVSAIRWAVVDRFHALTGLRPPELHFGRLAEKSGALIILIEIHYRHYLFYANMCIAIGIAYVCYELAVSFHVPWEVRALVMPLEVLLLIASRETLGRYYHRTKQLLGTRVK